MDEQELRDDIFEGIGDAMSAFANAKTVTVEELAEAILEALANATDSAQALAFVAAIVTAAQWYKD